MIVDGVNQLKDALFVFEGAFSRDFCEAANVVITARGGSIQEKVSLHTDFLVIGEHRGISPPESAAEKLIANGSKIQVITARQFEALCELSVRELEEGLRNPEIHEVVRSYLKLSNAYNLNGIDLSNIQLNGFILTGLSLDCSDLSDSELAHVSFPALQGTKLDNANFSFCFLTNCTGCSFKAATLSTTNCTDSVFQDCNFEGATINGGGLSRTVFRNCNMRNVSILRSNLNNCTFIDCDLTLSKLNYNQLSSVSFKSSSLVDANLSKSNLSVSSFDSSNLANAKFFSSILVGADFTSAKLQATDFSGAALADVCIDESQRNAIVGGNFPNISLSRTPGPDGKELDLFVQRCSLFTSEIIVIWNQDEYFLSVSKTANKSGTFEGRAERRTPPSTQVVISISAPSISSAMLMLATPFHEDSLLCITSLIVHTRGNKSNRKELQVKTLGAWCESFGIPVPDTRQMESLRCAEKRDQDSLRQQLIQELESGQNGIESWNSRHPNEKLRASHFRNCDLSHRNLFAVQLGKLNFNGSVFDHANLSESVFRATSLQKASFKNACLAKSRLWTVKAISADFTDADLSGADLRGSSFTGANFSNANLTDCDLSHCKLQGANLATAILRNVNLTEAEVDDLTKFPKGWTPTSWRD